MEKRKTRVSHVMPCSVTLLTAAAGGKNDAMTATCMFISEEPPLLVVSIDKRSLTHEFIEETAEFTLNIASTSQVGLAKKLGALHGKKVDKFKSLGISAEPGTKVKAPAIKGAFASIECKVITSFPVSRYTIYVAEAIDYTISEKTSPVAWHQDRYYKLTDEAR
jgi:flavin reductase (DIM6/NTAB) family NADH-FMN oxidoreductase RutF